MKYVLLIIMLLSSVSLAYGQGPNDFRFLNQKPFEKELFDALVTKDIQMGNQEMTAVTDSVVINPTWVDYGLTNFNISIFGADTMTVTIKPISGDEVTGYMMFDEWSLIKSGMYIDWIKIKYGTNVGETAIADVPVTITWIVEGK